MNRGQRSVLITGCSSGIGQATARMLAVQGYRVWAGARQPADVDALNQLSLATLHPVTLDVTNENDVRRVVEELQQACPEGLYALINNAGLGLPQAVELTTPDQFRQLLEVNAVGPLRLIQQCLPLLRVGRGRIVNISSMNGEIALPMVGAYSASKFALEALSDTLRVELRPWGIPVSLVRPGQIRTPIFDKARKQIAAAADTIPLELQAGYGEFYVRGAKFNERGSRSHTTPERVAQTIHRALESRWPRPRYVVGFDALALQWINRLAPQRLIDRGLARVMGLLKNR